MLQRLQFYLQDFVQLSVVHKDLPGYAFLHDLSVSAGRYVIFQNPVQLRMLPLLLGTLCPVHCIDWTSQPSHIHLLPRPATAAHSLPVSTARDAAQLRQENVAAGVQQAEHLQTQQLGPGSPEAACQVAKKQRPADSMHSRGDSVVELEMLQAAAGKAQLRHEKDFHCSASAGSAPQHLRAQRQQISQNALWRIPRQWRAEGSNFVAHLLVLSLASSLWQRMAVSLHLLMNTCFPAQSVRRSWLQSIFHHKLWAPQSQRLCSIKPTPMRRGSRWWWIACATPRCPTLSR